MDTASGYFFDVRADAISKLLSILWRATRRGGEWKEAQVDRFRYTHLSTRLVVVHIFGFVMGALFGVSRPHHLQK